MPRQMRSGDNSTNFINDSLLVFCCILWLIDGSLFPLWKMDSKLIVFKIIALDESLLYFDFLMLILSSGLVLSLACPLRTNNTRSLSLSLSCSLARSSKKASLYWLSTHMVWVLLSVRYLLRLPLPLAACHKEERTWGGGNGITALWRIIPFYNFLAFFQISPRLRLLDDDFLPVKLSDTIPIFPSSAVWASQVFTLFFPLFLLNVTLFSVKKKPWVSFVLMEIDLNHAITEVAVQKDIFFSNNGAGDCSSSSCSSNASTPPIASPSPSSSSSVLSELWHACAGPLATLPKKGRAVVYFPQGHLEQSTASSSPSPSYLAFQSFDILQPQIICRVVNVQLLVSSLPFSSFYLSSFRWALFSFIFH